MEQAFQVAIPLIGKIQIDVGTVLSALVFLGFLVIGFDYISAMFFGSMERNRYRNAADYYEEQARNIREARDTNLEGSFEWEQQNSLYKKMLNKSNDFRVKGGGDMNEFDCDYGEYDRPTSADYERWEDEKLLEQDRIRREQATEEELNDPYFDVPY